MTGYATICPLCGQQLAPVAQDPTSPPWLCRHCRQGWWAAELTTSARAIFRPHRHDFRPHKDVRAAVQKEAQLAAQRGTSLRHDQVHLVPQSTLKAVAGRRLTAEMAQAVGAHLKGTE